MKFSLIVVAERNGNRVNGNWVQNHIGDMESATKLLRDYSEFSPKSTYVIVKELSSCVPGLSFWKDLEILIEHIPQMVPSGK
jgi:hypothetical protein